MGTVSQASSYLALQPREASWELPESIGKDTFPYLPNRSLKAMGAVAQSPWEEPYPKLSRSRCQHHPSSLLSLFSDMGTIRDYQRVLEIYPEVSK